MLQWSEERMRHYLDFLLMDFRWKSISKNESAFFAWQVEKSAEVVVVGRNEPMERLEGLTTRWRTEHWVVRNSIRRLASLTIKYDKGVAGEKSSYIILSEPLYTRPVRTVVWEANRRLKPTAVYSIMWRIFIVRPWCSDLGVQLEI